MNEKTCGTGAWSTKYSLGVAALGLGMWLLFGIAGGRCLAANKLIILKNFKDYRDNAYPAFLKYP